jgi:hypothetical protein
MAATTIRAFHNAAVERKHLPGAKEPLPGSSVQIEQMPRIAGAKAKEARVIARSKPPYNKQGK